MSQQSSESMIGSTKISREHSREADAYQYLDARLTVIWHTSIPWTDDEAIDYFTFVRNISPKFHPKYIAVKRPGAQRYDVLPVWYEEETDDVWDL